MLAQSEALLLVRRADSLPVEFVGNVHQALKEQAADVLTVFQQKRDFVRAHFEDGARAFNVV